MATQQTDSTQKTPAGTPVLDEIADLEEYAQRGERPPRCKGYRIRVNRKHFVVHKPEPLGREILKLAGFVPPQDYTLRMKVHGGRPEKIGLDEQVDLTRRGIEKFKALPRDQTDG